MAKYPFFSLLSQYFLNLLIIRGDDMENVDICVCCGSIVPEGTMVCAKCNGAYKTNYSMDIVRFVEEMCGTLKWHQRLLLKIYVMSFKKQSRKGLHRYF